MTNEDTVFDNRMNNHKETVAGNSSINEKKVEKNENKNKLEDANPAGEDDQVRKDKSNIGKRVAAVTAGAAAVGTAGTAGIYFMNDEDVATEEIVAEPIEENVVTSNHIAQEPQPSSKSVSEPQLQPASEPKPVPEPAPKPQIESESESEPEPEVEILGVEVVHSENGDMTLGGMKIDGEEFVLVDVDGGDFDVAWHDTNHDRKIQENELIDIRDEHISVDDFVQASEYGNDDYTSDSNGNLMGENNMDPMDPTENDYMDNSDASGLM